MNDSGETPWLTEGIIYLVRMCIYKSTPRSRNFCTSTVAKSQPFLRLTLLNILHRPPAAIIYLAPYIQIVQEMRDPKDLYIQAPLPPTLFPSAK